MKLQLPLGTKFSPQLAFDVAKLKDPVRWEDKLASVKFDGIRALTADFRAATRSFKDLPNKSVADRLREWQGLDGELIVGSPTAEDVYRVTDSAVMTQKGEPDFVYYVFDDLTRLDLPFEDRLKILQDRTLPDWIQVVEQQPLADKQEADNHYAMVLDFGYEGLMLRNRKSLYKFGRCTGKTQDSLKWKPHQDSEAYVLEVLEAQTNNNEAFINELGRTARSSHAENKEGKGVAGAFLVKDLVTGVEFKISAGKMTHAQREEVWRNKASYVRRIAKYRHFTVGVKDKPRHGRWIGWRSPLDM